jgi:hypothetical protein
LIFCANLNCSYAKGASVIRMLHDYLGADTFMKGVRAYLRQFAYKNTHSDDLWKSLAAASGKPVCISSHTFINTMSMLSSLNMCHYHMAAPPPPYPK